MSGLSSSKVGVGSKGKEEKKEKKKPDASSIRVFMPTRNLLSDIQKTIADKAINSKVGVDDIVHAGLELLKNSKDAISKLQLKNMSMEDEEQYTYQVYQKQNGAISWKEFKKKLRRGDLVKLMKSIGLEV